MTDPDRRFYWTKYSLRYLEIWLILSCWLQQCSCLSRAHVRCKPQCNLSGSLKINTGYGTKSCLSYKTLDLASVYSFVLFVRASWKRSDLSSEKHEEIDLWALNHCVLFTLCNLVIYKWLLYSGWWVSEYFYFPHSIHITLLIDDNREMFGSTAGPAQYIGTSV